MFTTQSIAIAAEPKATEFKRRTWCDRTLVKTHLAAVAFGIGIVLYTQHYAPPATKADAATLPAPTTSTTVLASAEGK